MLGNRHPYRDRRPRGSLNAIESELRVPKRLDGLVGRAKPSADRIGDVFCLIPPEDLRAMLCGINHQLGRNKVLSKGGRGSLWRSMAMNFFPSRNRCCEACSERRVKVHGREEIEYYHRGVICHLVGFEVALPLDVEMLRPGEGEISAAKRLLERVIVNYGRFFDGVLGDALYLEAPFFNFCIDHGKHLIAVIRVICSRSDFLVQNGCGHLGNPVMRHLL